MERNRKNFKVQPVNIKTLAILVIATAITGISQAQVRVSETVIETRINSEAGNFRIVRVVENLEHPWAIGWLPDGRMLVTERPGRIHIIDGATDLVDLQTIYTMMPRTQPGRHYGSRILFPGDGTVIFSIGDRRLRHPSQDLTDPAGSMIRLLEDGGAAPGNPFAGSLLRQEIYRLVLEDNRVVHKETLI